MQISKFVNKHRNLLILFLIAAVVLISYGLTLKMYFWVDDWGLAYKMIFPEVYPHPSNLGAGIFGEGAYRFLATPFIFLYPLFGLDASKYYFLALLQYIIAAFLVYKFVEKVSGNKSISLASGLIFASGYVGSYAMYRLSNSFQLIETTIFSVLISWLLVKHYQTGRLSFYLASLILFIFTLEVYFLRSQGLIFIVLACLIFAKEIKNLKTVALLLVKQIPFVFVYYFFYFLDYRGGIESSGVGGSGFLKETYQLIVAEGNIVLLKNFLLDLTNMLIPDKIVHSTLPLGIVLLLVSGAVFMIRRKNYVSRFIPFSLIWVASNLIGYFIYMPTSSLSTNSRYEIPALVGTAIFYSSLFYLVGKKYLLWFGVTALCLVLIYFSRQEQSYIIKMVSIPDKQGYSLILNEVKNVNSKTTFYVEVENDPEIKSNVLGNLAQLGIPAVLKYKGTVQIADTYTDLKNLLLSGKTDLNDIYSYRFSRNGYVSTTSETRSNLAAFLIDNRTHK